MVLHRNISKMKSVFKYNRACVRFNSDSKAEVKKPGKADPKKLYQWKEPQGHDTGIKVTNSYRCLGKKSGHVMVPLIVKNPKHVTWYACGPTVYDHAHIGHASSYVRLDVIRRVLQQFFDLDINMVMGITDIDDKIIQKSNFEGREFSSIAGDFEEDFKKDMTSLNVLPPSMHVRVSDVIPQILSFIDRIIKNGHAYSTTKGNVWFKAHEFTDVGRLAHFRQEWERVAKDTMDPERQSPTNFALWKAAKAGEPYWEAPWGKGRPGWHVECSAISSLMFGDTIDIHTGARDLCFPHHECEILQSESFHQCEQWVNYFLHTGHLTNDGFSHKMSKSLGNTITIPNLLKKFTADDFRYYCFECVWIDDLVFSDTSMKNARSQTKKMRTFLTRCQQYVLGNLDGHVDSCKVTEYLGECKQMVDVSLRENINVALVLCSLEKLLEQVNTMFTSEIEIETWTPGFVVREPACIVEVYQYVTQIFSKLGFTSMNATSLTNESVSDVNTRKTDGDRTEVLEDCIDFRKSVRKTAIQMKREKSPHATELLDACDNVRARLVAKGYQVEDHKVSS